LKEKLQNPMICISNGLLMNHLQEKVKQKKVLSWPADLSLEEHGYTLPKYPKLKQIDDFLGSGPHSNVYLGTYESNEQVVVKVMDRDLCVSHEESVLASLQHLEHVPKVVASHKSSSSCPSALILRPYAFHFSAFEMSREEVLNSPVARKRKYFNWILIVYCAIAGCCGCLKKCTRVIGKIPTAVTKKSILFELYGVLLLSERI